jgi:hypothetical protein
MFSPISKMRRGEKNMNKQENDNQTIIEDLAVNQDQAAEVKGGPVDHTIYVPMHVITAR